VTGKPDIAQAADRTREGEAAPARGGASDPPPAPQQQPARTVPAGEPEAPVTPVVSVKSESVAAQSGAAPPEAGGAARPDGAGDVTATDGTPGAEASTATDHERQLEHDLEELTAKAEKADEYLELAQRTRADFDNYRKRAAREAAAAQERGVAKLAKELLPAVDNLDRALEAAQSAARSPADGAPGAKGADNGTATLVSGIKLVYDDVIAALARAGIERYSPEGELFDPQQHEAIAQQPVEGAQPGTVVEVYQRGYRLGEFVIRPARVVVAA
jgi:molecular chaperone GrpE